MNGRKGLQRLIYILIGVLIFEGIARKLMPDALSRPAILVKDVVALVIAMRVTLVPLPAWLNTLRMLWMGVAIAIVPLIILTALNDPILAIFGAKQYLLFMPIAWAVPLAFSSRKEPYKDLFRYHRWLAASVPLTAAVAMIQVTLPTGHWLNLSVAGDDLSAFSAGGQLRVSSTFPFIAQYCWYSLAVVASVALAIRYPGKGPLAGMLKWWVIIPFLVVGTFITGSRQSVIGLIIVVAVAGMLILVVGGGKGAGRLIGFVAALFVGLFVGQAFFPEGFIAYDARSGGETFSEENTEELQHRLEHALLGWRYFADRSEAGLFGHGLGAMSNGVTQFSAYAASVREQYGWGEVDMANTVAEGGYYLVIVWMSFRGAVVFFSLQILLKLRNATFRLSGALAAGYIAFMGVTGTLAMQPPLYIWWTLCIGSLCAFYACEQRLIRERAKKKGQGEAEGTAQPAIR